MLSANVCIKILKYIKYNSYVTSLELAEQFSMSRRNILRYIRLLKYHNLVFVTRGNGGGISYKGVL